MSKSNGISFAVVFFFVRPSFSPLLSLSHSLSFTLCLLFVSCRFDSENKKWYCIFLKWHTAYKWIKLIRNVLLSATGILRQKLRSVLYAAGIWLASHFINRFTFWQQRRLRCFEFNLADIIAWMQIVTEGGKVY